MSLLPGTENAHHVQRLDHIRKLESGTRRDGSMNQSNASELFQESTVHTDIFKATGFERVCEHQSNTSSSEGGSSDLIQLENNPTSSSSVRIRPIDIAGEK